MKNISYALMLSPIILFGHPEKEQKPIKPNILFLFADDQRVDAMGCSGNAYIKTPNIDQLAKTGVRFSNNYIMGGNNPAVCQPSRAMLLSGKSLFHIGGNLGLQGVTTMPQYFRENGYETFGTGKWHNGEESFERSFDKGENVFLGGMCDHFNVPCRDLGENGKLSKPVGKGYSANLFAGAAINFLNKYSKGKKDKPFFCYVAFTSPHDPRSPRKDYVGMYPDGSIPVPGNFMKYHPFAFDDMQIRDENLAPWPRTPEVIQKSLSDYYAMISLVDKKVGEIITTLKKNGLLENTIIVYSADNGLSIGSHGLLGKQNLYEESVKVPLIISGPKLLKGKVSQDYTYLFDLFPTLCDLTGLSVPSEIDGKDISAILEGDGSRVRSSVFMAYRTTVRAVREDDWKLIRYPDRDYTQLFNLKDDPLEINNLAEDSIYKPRVDHMLKMMERWQKETNDTTTLTAKKILPMEYDPTQFKQKADIFQPEYVLKRFFKGVDLGKRNSHD